MTAVERKRRFIINTVYAAIVVALFYLFFKYVAGAVFPILFAIVWATVLQRPVNFICRKTPLKRGFVSAIVVLLSFLFVVSIVFGALVWAISEIKGFFQYLFIRFQDLPTLINTIEGYLLNLTSFLPDKLSASAGNFIQEKANEIANGSSMNLPEFDFSVLATPLSGLWNTAKAIPTTLVSVVVSIVACCFMTSDYKSLKNLILNIFHEETRNKVIRAKRLLLPALGKLAKAYGIIITITFTEICIGLFILNFLGIYNSGYIFLIAALTAIVDIVPVLGTGTVVIPWAVYSLFTGNIPLAIGLLIMYVCITVIRQIIEPKLVATQLGIPAFLTITSMFIGSLLFGVAGIFILPVAVVMLKLLNDEGIIHIFHSSEKDEEEKKQ